MPDSLRCGDFTGTNRGTTGVKFRSLLQLIGLGLHYTGRYVEAEKYFYRLYRPSRTINCIWRNYRKLEAISK